MSTPLLSIGNQARQQEFIDRHQLLFDNQFQLRLLANNIFSNCHPNSLQAVVIYPLARIAIEDDFWSILILSANGYSHSASIVLRGMFERVVSAKYLSLHPDHAELFWEFCIVDQHKALNRIRNNPAISFPRDHADYITTEFQRVKDRYMVPDCKKCGTYRLNHSWSRKDIVTMAKETGFSFDVIECAYYRAMEEAHPKIQALFNRSRQDTTNQPYYNELPDLHEADDCVLVAAQLQRTAIEVLKHHFQVQGIDDLLLSYLKRLSEYFTHIATLKRDIPQS